MTSIDRTAYPRFARRLSEEELEERYDLTPAERRFLASNAGQEVRTLHWLSCSRRGSNSDIFQLVRRCRTRFAVTLSTDLACQRKHHFLMRCDKRRVCIYAANGFESGLKVYHSPPPGGPRSEHVSGMQRIS